MGIKFFGLSRTGDGRVGPFQDASISIEPQLELDFGNEIEDPKGLLSSIGGKIKGVYVGFTARF
jgi:hypothetical protein